MHEIKVTHMEAQDFSVRLGSDICISRVENPTGTLSSSLCQTLNKETVGLILVIRVWLLIVRSFIQESQYHKWSLTIFDRCFDTLKSSKMQS